MPLTDETRRQGAEMVRKKLTGTRQIPRGYAKIRASGGKGRTISLSVNIPTEHHQDFPQGSIMKVTRDSNRLIYELVEKPEEPEQEPAPLINPNWNKQ